MIGLSGAKALGSVQSRHERQVALSYYKLSKKIELMSKSLEKNLNIEISKPFLCSNHSIECILLSLKISPGEKNLIKEYIETPFFKILTKKKSKEELKILLKEVALSIIQIDADSIDVEAVAAISLIENTTVGSFFDILNSYEFNAEQKFIVQEFSKTTSLYILFDLYKRIFEGKIPKNIIIEILNEFISALSLYNLNNKEEFYKSLNSFNPIDISKLYCKLAFKKSIATLFNNADVNLKLRIIEELLIKVVVPDSLTLSAYEEFDLEAGYFKKCWNNNGIYNSSEQKTIISLSIKKEKEFNGFCEYSLIQKLFELNINELNEYKTVCQSLGFDIQLVLDTLHKELEASEFQKIFKNSINVMVFLDSSNYYTTDPIN